MPVSLPIKEAPVTGQAGRGQDARPAAPAALDPAVMDAVTDAELENRLGDPDGEQVVAAGLETAELLDEDPRVRARRPWTWRTARPRALRRGVGWNGVRNPMFYHQNC